MLRHRKAASTRLLRCTILRRGLLGRRAALQRRTEVLEVRRELVRRRFVAILLAQRCTTRWLAATRVRLLRCGVAPHPRC